MSESAQDSNSFAKQASDEQIQKTVAALTERGFKVEVVDTLEDAKKYVLGTIPDGAEVFTATSVTVDESGLGEALNAEPYVSVRNSFMHLWGQDDKKLEMRRLGGASDYTVGSVHAITEDGEVMIASASGSQLPNYTYGASNVIWLVGSQKLVKDMNQGFERIDTYTLPLEDVRAQAAYGIHSSHNTTLIYHKDPASRVTVVIIREVVGY